MTTHSIDPQTLPVGHFRTIHPELERRYDSPTLLGLWNPAQNIFFGGVRPSDLSASILLTNKEEIIAFIADIKRRLSLPIDDAWVTSAGDKIFNHLAPVIYMEEGVHYQDSSMKRPRFSPSDLISSVWLIDYILENWADAEWMTPEKKVAIVTTMLEVEPNYLRKIHRLFFGIGSAGWLNKQEKDALIKAIKGAISDTTAAGYVKIVTDNGGDLYDFQAVWTTYRAEMITAQQMYEAIPFIKNYRGGQQPYQEAYNVLGIGHTTDQIRAWAQMQYDHTIEVLNAIAELRGYPDWKAHRRSLANQLPVSVDLVTAYQEAMDRVRTVSGIKPALPGDYELIIMATPEGLVHDIPAAAVQGATYDNGGSGKRKAFFYVTLAEPENAAEDDLLLHKIEQWFERFTTSAHEGTIHGGNSGMRPLTVHKTLNSWGLNGLLEEGLAVMSEWELAEKMPTLENIMAALRLWAQRLARILAEYAYHLDGMEPDEAIKFYADLSDKSLSKSEDDLRRAFTRPPAFSMYALATGGVQILCNSHFNGDMAATITFFMNQSSGILPYSIMAELLGWIEDRFKMNWLPSLADTILFRIADEFIANSKPEVLPSDGLQG